MCCPKSPQKLTYFELGPQKPTYHEPGLQQVACRTCCRCQYVLLARAGHLPRLAFAADHLAWSRFMSGQLSWSRFAACRLLRLFFMVEVTFLSFRSQGDYFWWDLIVGRQNDRLVEYYKPNLGKT